MKNLFHKFPALAFVFVFLLLNTCQKDDEITNHVQREQTKSGITVKRVAFSELEKKVSLKEQLGRLSKHFKSIDDTGVSTKVDANDGAFSVLTDRILEVSTDSTTAYTFLIETPTSPLSTFENFVVIEDINNAYDLFIYRYSNNGTEGEFPYDISREEVSEGQIDLGDFNSLDEAKIIIEGTDGCIYELDLVWHCMDYETDEVDCYWDWVIDRDCSGVGGGNTTTGSGDDGNVGDDPNDHGGNNSPPGEIGDSDSPHSGPNESGEPPVGVIEEAPSWQKILICMNSLPEPGVVDNTTLTPEMVSWLQAQPKRDVAPINNYLQENACSEEAQELALIALQKLMINECAILPIENSTNSSSTYTGDIGDEPDTGTQLDHDAIKSQYETYLANNDKNTAINYLISSYSMENFASLNVTGNYTFSFVNGEEPEAITYSTFSANGTYESSHIVINDGLLTYYDFGWITRAIKHELFHVFQAKYYPYGATTNNEREFEAYWYSIYRFTKLKRGDDASETRWAYKVRDFYYAMTESQKQLVADKWSRFLLDYREICN